MLALFLSEHIRWEILDGRFRAVHVKSVCPKGRLIITFRARSYLLVIIGFVQRIALVVSAQVIDVVRCHRI